MDLWEAYRGRGEETAREALVLRHGALVHREARRLYRHDGSALEVADLVSAGMTGLIEAVDSFEPSRGLAFSTYAVPRIRGAIIDQLRRWDALPRSARGRERALRAARETLASSLGRRPTEKELAEHLEVDGDTVARWRRDAATAVRISYERPSTTAGEEGCSLREVLPLEQTSASDDLAREEEAALLREAVSRLPERDRQVLALYYYEGLTLREIGELLGVTESRVSQIRTAILAELRERLGHLRAA